MFDSDIQQIIDGFNAPFRVEEFLKQRHKLRGHMIVEFCNFRIWHGLMTQITSAYRESGSHQYGTAIDFILWSKWQKQQPDIMKMWRIVTTWPWQGVGIYFDWDEDASNDIDEPVIGFHVDLCTQNQRHRPLRWLRVNGEYYYQSVHDGLFHHKSGAVTTLEEQITAYLHKNENK